jgi:hypothetical protein
MARITMTCNRCGASITDDMAHVLDWNDRHDATCPKLTTEVTR